MRPSSPVYVVRDLGKIDGEKDRHQVDSGKSDDSRGASSMDSRATESREELEAAIAEEKRMIAALERRLAGLEKEYLHEQERREQSLHQQPKDEELFGADILDDPLDMLFHNPEALSSTSKLLESVAKLEQEQEEKVEWQAMQPLIREFRFTHVDRILPTTTAIGSAGKDVRKASYKFKGYFTVQPDMKVEFLTTFELPPTTSRMSSEKKAANTSAPNQKSWARMTELSCQLISGGDRVTETENGSALVDNDMKQNSSSNSLDWLVNKTRPSPDPLNLAAWISNLHRYLAFDRQRRAFLAAAATEEQNVKIHTLQVNQARYLVGIGPKLAGTTTATSNERKQQHQQSYRLQLMWGYKFGGGMHNDGAPQAHEHHHNDVLRLTQDSNRLNQRQLDALVRTCGHSCSRALTVMARHIGRDPSRDAQVLRRAARRRRRRHR